jgi:FtsH-binding integral membrane protein
LLVLGIIPLIIFPERTAEIVWSSISIFIFSSYILYDTSSIINRYKAGEEVSAALDLYLDFVNIFWDFIRLFKTTNSIPTEDLSDSTVDIGTDHTINID